MKQQKETHNTRSSKGLNQSVSNMNAITLKVLHLIKECLSLDGTWPTKDKNVRSK